MNLMTLTFEAMKVLAMVTVALPAMLFSAPAMLRSATAGEAAIAPVLLGLFWILIGPVIAVAVYIYKLIALGAAYLGMAGWWSEGFDGTFVIVIAFSGFYGWYKALQTFDKLGPKLDTMSGVRGYEKVDTVISWICGAGAVMGTVQVARALRRKS